MMKYKLISKIVDMLEKELFLFMVILGTVFHQGLRNSVRLKFLTIGIISY
jgi:hypothetical protein